MKHLTRITVSKAAVDKQAGFPDVLFIQFFLMIWAIMFSAAVGDKG